MTRVSVQIPPSLHERAKQLAKSDGVSLDQFIALALAEKLSALNTLEYLRTRAARGTREEFDRALAKIPARKPLPGDELPPANTDSPAATHVQNPWWNQIAGSLPNDKRTKEAAWYGRQWRDSHIELQPSAQLERLRRNYNSILNKLKILGRFKTKRAAAEYAHREFTR